MRKSKKIKLLSSIIALIIVVVLSFTLSCKNKEIPKEQLSNSNVTLDNIPDYTDKAYVEINNNVPYFTSEEITNESFEQYNSLDSLGRCTVAYACLSTDLMPTEKRGEIGSVHPTGWHSDKYDFVDGENLYNRCHLIGYQLSGENANERNLVTGTRYMNVTGMLPFENMVTDYIKETNNHVMYRVTPIFKDDDLVCRGVEMEGYSVEDNGDSISYNVFVYNVQPGVYIDYKTGDNHLENEKEKPTEDENKEGTYILNVKSKKFHLPTCSGVKDIKEENKKEFTGKRSELINEGYKPCNSCNP